MTTALSMNRETQMVWQPKSGMTPKTAGTAVCAFLDTATTSMGRATHYNTREDQQVAELAAHESLLHMSRDIYTVLLGVPGVTDRAVQVGMRNLLSTHRDVKDDEFLRAENERTVLSYLMQALPPQRMLKMIQTFRLGDETLGLKKANNAKTRKLVLRTLLASPRLALWTVKYRSKMAEALVHAWGQKLSTVIRVILAKAASTQTPKEQKILKDQIQTFSGVGNYKLACECIGFVFGNREGVRNPMLRAYTTARTDLKAAAKAGLPLEVLEGIRSTFHKTTTHDEVVRLMVKDGKLTDGQKMAVQKQAEKAGVEVEMDPTKFDPVRLYLYAFERGLDEKIQKALEQKAVKAAAAFPAHYGRVGIVVDASASMAGDKTQALRPMAATLALRDMLQKVGDSAVTEYVGGQMGELVRPMGDTSLADGLMKVLMADPAPEAVFVLSDGYENAPSGRFAEVMEQVREIGVNTPVYHLNPVFAAESGKVRELAPKTVPTMPVRSPEALGSAILRGLIENEPLKGINALIGSALKSGPVGSLPAVSE